MLKLKTHLDVLTLGVNREKKCVFFPSGRTRQLGVQMKSHN